MPTFLIRHTTTYCYRSPVAFGEHRLMLRPRDGLDQHVTRFGLEVTPSPASVAWSEDPFGNPVATARFGRRASALVFTAESRVDTRAFSEAALGIADHARRAPFAYGAEEAADLARFVERQHLDEQHAVDAWSRAVLDEDRERETWAFLKRLSRRIRDAFAYLRREEAGIQPPALTLRLRRGTCRDFAVLMAEAVRAQGLAARFVSGYLHVRGPEDGTGFGGSTHAWLQVYLPGAGWIDFDPTSGTAGNADLVRVAVVREPRQAAPLSGTFLGFPHDDLGLSVAVEVSALPASGAEAGPGGTGVAA